MFCVFVLNDSAIVRDLGSSNMMDEKNVESVSGLTDRWWMAGWLVGRHGGSENGLLAVWVRG